MRGGEGGTRQLSDKNTTNSFRPGLTNEPPFLKPFVLESHGPITNTTPEVEERRRKHVPSQIRRTVYDVEDYEERSVDRNETRAGSGLRSGGWGLVSQEWSGKTTVGNGPMTIGVRGGEGWGKWRRANFFLQINDTHHSRCEVTKFSSAILYLDTAFLLDINRLLRPRLHGIKWDRVEGGIRRGGERERERDVGVIRQGKQLTKHNTTKTMGQCRSTH